MEKWGDIGLITLAQLQKQEALNKGIGALINNLRDEERIDISSIVSFVKDAKLEIIPVAPNGWYGTIGSGY